LREASSLWSLTEQAGFLTVETGNSYLLSEGGNTPLLLYDAPDGDFELRARLLFSPAHNFQSAAIVIYADDDHYVSLNRALRIMASPCPPPDVCTGDGVYLDDDQRHIAGDIFVNFTGDVPTGQPILLRLIRRGETYMGYWSLDGNSWVFVAETTASLDPVGVGLFANNGETGSPSVPAYFDFFEVRLLGY
jgi:hypothetical protein